ncbi:MAG: DNA polymerase III subunit gamma/tau [Geminicoccaceae bacterium]|nr:DNA polymerase III subunit gamma/tau [Geminicoccaceae bacterium]MCX8100097.1 DNA polymerase III subunit gamma/tau [Geminicoccaceae bacterium]
MPPEEGAPRATSGEGPERGYRVLARAYRPQRLSELIGQDVLVRTVSNAFRTGRIAHAFLLSGIRGVGKTTTARILARGLNCTGADGRGGPTPEPCGLCPSCVAIAEDRSLDVIEMDAASQTGKADVLDLVQGIQLAPLASRYKVYILDEVHMLSEKAWNALLKTVEEPPPHAKFVFATTELRKVPLTVLSRCQRFELRRVEPARLVAHLAAVCSKEGILAEPAALELLAAAAEGSVRDALSLLDQAIATGEGRVEAAIVREMLGLSDRGRVLDLLEAALSGETGLVLDRFGELHALGAEPRMVLQDLLHLVHLASRLAAGVEPAALGAPLDAPQVERLRALLGREDLPRLSRAWQILLKGLEEVRTAPSAPAAAEMVLLRLACVAELPPPGELARLLREGGTAAVPAPRAPARPTAPTPVRPTALDPAAPSAAPAAPAPRPVRREGLPAAEDAASTPGPTTLEGIVQLLREAGQGALAAWLHEGAHLVRLEPGLFEFRPEPGMPEDLPKRLARALGALDGRPWSVRTSSEPGAPTLGQQAAQRKAARIDELRREEPVRTALALFPGAEIVDVRPRRPSEPKSEPRKGTLH